MESELQNCPTCGIDLTKVRDVINADSMAFCLQCQFPLQLVAGKYRLTKEIWRGGTSTVYLAEHIMLEQDAERVVKVIRPEIFTIRGMERRFQREVQLTSALSQRNNHIIRIYDDFGEIPKLGHFYVMEYLQGETLSEMLEKLAQLPPLAFCMYLFLQLCDTMQYAHTKGVVHRDLKPHNLMLVQREYDDYFLKVFDFGIAKPLSSEELAITHVTQGSLGTPAYMSPEQCLNQPTDVRTDIYSMGVILYELLTGRTPFLPPDNEESNYFAAIGIIESHLTQTPPSLCELQPQRVNKELEQVVMRTLAKKAMQRYQSVEELRHAVESAIEQWPPNERELLSQLLNDKIKPTIDLPRKKTQERSAESVLEPPIPVAQDTNKTWCLGSLSRVMFSNGEEQNLTHAPSATSDDLPSKGHNSDHTQPISEGNNSPLAATSTPMRHHKYSPLLDYISGTEKTSRDDIFLTELSIDEDDDFLLKYIENTPPSSSECEPSAELDPLDLGDNISDPTPETSLNGDESDNVLVREFIPEQTHTGLNQNAAPTHTANTTYLPQDTNSNEQCLNTEDTGTQAEDNGTQTEDNGTQAEDTGTQAEDTTSVELASIEQVKVNTTGKTHLQPKDHVDFRKWIDRMHGPKDGLVQMFMRQETSWESDPFLVKKLREQVVHLRKYIDGEDFAQLYPGCKGKIVLEAHSFPPEVAGIFMRDKVELRLLPNSAVHNSDVPILMPPKQPSLKDASPKSSPQVSTSSQTARTASTPASKQMQHVQTVGAKHHQGTITPPSPATKAINSDKVNARPLAPTNGQAKAINGGNSSIGQIHVDLWEDPEFQNRHTRHLPHKYTMVALVAIFLFSAIGILYGLGDDRDSNIPVLPRTIQADQVSTYALPSPLYANITLRPDLHVFAFIPVFDSRNNQREFFVLFAAKENRRLLVFAPQDKSQVLQGIELQRDPDNPEQTHMKPVWSRDLFDAQTQPQARTYTGLLEKLQRQPNGPLEIQLPDGNYNLNKLREFTREGIRFPLDSMLLTVGKRPPAPPSHPRKTILSLSLVLAIISAGLFFVVLKLSNQPF